MTRYYSNVSKVMTLTAPMDLDDTVASVSDASGLPASFPYNIVADYEASSVEVMSVTSAAGNNLTVVRGQEDTAASTHSTGATVVHAATALDFQDAQAHYAATSNVHGTGAGTVVGTSTSQTLTNKTMSGASNTFTNLPASAITGSFASITSTGLITGVGVTTTGAITATGQAITSATLTTTGAVTSGGLLTGSAGLSITGAAAISGAITSGSIAASGLITANAGVTVPSGQTLTLASGSTFTSAATAAHSGTNTFSGTVNHNAAANFGAAGTIGQTAGNVGTFAGTNTFSGSVALNGAITRDATTARMLMIAAAVDIGAGNNMTTSASFVDIPDLTATFTVPAGRTATLVTTLTVNGFGGSSANTMEFNANLDGSDYSTNGWSHVWSGSAQNATTSKTVIYTGLAAGSHTIKFRQKRSGGADAVSLRSPQTGMTYQVFW